MNRFLRRSRDNAQIRAEAAEWLVSFCEREVDRQGREEFYAWLRTSPEHVRAYLEISALWEATGSLNERAKLEADDLVQLALAEPKIIPFSRTLDPQDIETRRGSNALRPALVACALIVLASAIYFAYSRLPEPLVYSTSVGEQRRLTLADSSIVTLDARSRIRVTFQRDMRLVDLLEGQALFHVAKNASRPFIVQSGDASVRAVGTQFDVNRMRSETVVTVTEGKIQVTAKKPETTVAHSSSAVSPVTTLVAGEQIRIKANAVASPSQADVSGATAWRAGRLVFDSTSIRDVVDTVNRHNARPVIIDAPEVLDLHMSGTFETTDSAPIVRFLIQRFGFTIQESNTRILLVRS